MSCHAKLSGCCATPNVLDHDPASGVCAALYPIDTIKTRLQSATHGGGLRALLQRGGGKALYSGLWGNLVGVAPASAIFMAVYNPVKQYIQQEVGSCWIRRFLGGFCCSRSRMQLS